MMVRVLYGRDRTPGASARMHGCVLTLTGPALQCQVLLLRRSNCTERITLHYGEVLLRPGKQGRRGQGLSVSETP